MKLRQSTAIVSALIFRKIIGILYAVLISTVLQAQTTYIANNNPGAIGGTNVFTGPSSLGQAIAAATTGDIIYVVPSGTAHPGNVVTKGVTIVGIGLDPNKVTPITSKISSLDLAASDIRVSGVELLLGAGSGSALTITASIYSNIMIDNCIFARFTTSQNVANLVLQNNIIGHDMGTAGNPTIDITTSSTGVRIGNNIIYGANFVNVSTDGWLRDLNGAIVENNVFIANGAGNQRVFNNVNSCNFKNNIFFGVSLISSGGSLTNNTFEYNISFNAATNNFPTTNGNTSSNDLENVNPLFVNLPFGKLYSFSYDPNLGVGSPGLGTGETGTDRGVLGGATPMDLTFTSLPTIQSVVVPLSVSQGDNLPANIKGNGN